MSHTTVAATAVEDAQTEDNTQVVMKNRPQSQCLLDIRPEFVFGLTIGLSGNCLFLNDHTIVYPATGVIVVYEMEMHSQKFVKLEAPRRTITAMDLSSINYVLAVATVHGDDEASSEDDAVEYERPTIGVYDLTSLNLICVFVEPDDGVSRMIQEPSRYFSHVQFLQSDDTFAVALAINHDGSGCSVYYYKWTDSTVDTCLRIDDHRVVDMALNPIDTSKCCFVGKDLFRLMTRTDEDWTQYGFREATGIEFNCVCWLCGDMCLAGTADGLVILFKNGVLLARYRAEVLIDLDVTVQTSAEDERPEYIDETGRLNLTKAVRRCFTSLYGLVLVIGDSTIHYFEKTDEGGRYVRKKVLVKREDRYLQSQRTTDEEKPKHFVENAYVSPNGEKLVCVTRRAQLYWAQLHGDNFNRVMDDEEQKKEENTDKETFDGSTGTIRSARDDANSPSTAKVVEVQPLGEHLHYGNVKCVSASLWKPIFMTCGKTDFTIKVWDYVECTLLLSKYYPRQVRSVSIHPTGLYSIAAFSDYVEYQLVQADDLVPLKTYTISGCTACAFSHSGHMFALAKFGVINVYCSVLFEKRFSCLGNSQAFVNILLWTNDDAIIVAYDSMGNLCSFDTKTCKLLTHIYLYSMAAQLTAGVDRMFVTSKDGLLTELYNKKVVRELNLHQGPLCAICISTSNSTLFVSSENGILMTIALPIMYQVELKEFKIHNRAITTMCSVPDESTLITCSEDGSMCIWKVTESNNHFAYTDDILIKWSKYQGIISNTEKLETTVHRLEREGTQEINALESSNEQETKTVKTINSAYCREIDEKNKDFIEVQKNAIRELEYELRELRETNERIIGNLDVQYCDRLASKYTRNLNLENQMLAAVSQSKKDLETLRQTVDNELLDTIKAYDEKLIEKYEQVLLWENKLNDEQKCLKMLVKNTEDDCEKQISEKKRQYVAEVDNLKELYLKTTKEVKEFKTKHKLYEKANNDLNDSVELLEAENEMLKELTGNKHHKIVDLRRLLQQYEEIDVQETAKIQKVTLQLIELEKELELLNDNIVSFGQITEQLTLKIQNREKQIEEYELEEDNASKTIKRLGLELAGLKEQKKDCIDELDREKQIALDQSNFINQMKVDMYAATKHQPTRNVTDANEKAMQEFFVKYVGPIAQHVYMPDDEELEARIEFARQRKFLETYIEGLKKTIELHTTKTVSYYAILEENVRLMEQIEILQKAAKTYSGKSINLKHSARDKSAASTAARRNDERTKKNRHCQM